MKLFGLLGSRHRKRGSELLVKGDWELAAAEFRRSIARNPDCVESLQGLGIALLKQQLWAEGEVVLDQAVARFPDLPASLHAQLGMARTQLSRWPEALVAFTRASEIEPSNPEYHGHRGTALLKLERWQEAVTAFDRAIEPNPDDSQSATQAAGIEQTKAEYHALRGTALLKLERWQEALVAFDQAIESKSQDEYAATKSKEIARVDAEYSGFRATALLRLERWQEAIEAFTRAIEGNPHESSYYEGQAQALFELGRYEETVAAARRCIELKSNVASMHVRLGAALLKLQRNAEAVPTLEQAIQIDSSLTDVHQMLAHAYAQIGENQLAIEAYQRVIELDPSAKTQITVPLAKLGFVDEQEITALRARVEAEPNSYGSIVQLASLLAIQKNWDETIEVAQRGLALQPEGRECHKLMGQAYLAQDHFESALACFRTALQKFSEYNFTGDDDELSLIRECYEGMATALANLDRSIESVEVYQRQLNVTFDPLMCLDIGRKLQQQEQDDLATRAFVRAIVMNHHHLDSYKVLGDHLERTGRPDEALVVYQEVNAMGFVDDDLRARLSKSLQRSTRLD